MENAFWDHMLQSALPTVKVCMLGAVGVVLARYGILDQHGRRALSRLIYFVFTPCLTFSKLAPVLSAQHLLLWMPLALNMFMSVAVGLLLGVLLVLLVKPPAGFNKHVIVCTGLGNAGNLPLVLVSALLRNPSAGTLFAGQAVSVDLAIAYVAMGIWAATITHFTVGTQLLKLPSSSSSSSSTGGSSGNGNAHGTSQKSEEQLPLVSEDMGKAQHQQEEQQQQLEQDAKGAKYQQAVELGSFLHSHFERGSRGDDSFVLRAQYDEQTEELPFMHCSSCGAVGGNICSCNECGSWQCLHCGCQHSTVAVLAQQQQQQDALKPTDDASAIVTVHATAVTAANALQCLHHASTCSHYMQQQQGSSNTPAAPADQQQQQQPQQQQQQQQVARAASRLEEQESLLGSPGQRLLGSSASASSWMQLDLSSPQQQSAYPMHAPQQRQQGSALRWCLGFCWLCARSAVRSAGGVVWALVSPPMVGCMLAVLVGVLPVIRNQLFTPMGHLLLIQDCIDMFGDCCIPSLMLMLGATLAKGPGRCCPPLHVVLGVTLARLLLLPALGTAWLLLASKAGWLHAPDSMFLLVMLIQNCVPTALNVHTLATLSSNREEEVGALLFWQYLAACLTVPACLMLFTWLLKTGALAVAG